MRDIRVIAFDVFGTVFDLSAVPRQEVKDYVAHIRKPEWSPLTLPESWIRLPAHLDARDGITWLRLRYQVVTMSNAPMRLLTRMSKLSQISWDAIIPIETKRVYKPNPAAYMTICELMGVEPAEVMMVTANKDFGDLEAAAALGMASMLIRTAECPKITDLANQLAGITPTNCAASRPGV